VEFVRGQELHPDIAPLSFLLGTWRGEGAGEYPTIDPFTYGEEMRFTHVGDPFLAYEQESWLLADGSPLHFERGFLRPAGETGAELVLAHPLGIVEVSEGPFSETDGASLLELASRIVGLTTTGERVTGLRRRMEIHGEDMAYELFMEMEAVPLTLHLEAELRRA
jgi:hypothetical protein